MSDYTTKPVKVRIFAEPLGLGPRDHQWCIDGVDDDGNFTEACWSYDSFADAVSELSTFWETYIRRAG